MSFKQRLALGLIRIKFKLLSVASKKKAAEKALDLFKTPQRRNTRQPPPIFEKAEKLSFELEGVMIHGYRWNLSAEKKVLIVHGFESSIVNFGDFVQPLIDKGYQVLAFDAPAHGISEGRTITAPLFAKMITTINEKFGPVKSFITHSFGGLALSIALETIKHDENYKVVFIAPATESKTAVDQFFHLLHLDNKMRKPFDELIRQIGGHPAEWYSIRRAMRNIKAQVLWLHDENDLQTPIGDVMKVKGDNFSNIKFIITTGLGHRRIYRDKKVMQQIIDFL